VGSIGWGVTKYQHYATPLNRKSERFYLKQVDLDKEDMNGFLKLNGTFVRTLDKRFKMEGSDYHSMNMTSQREAVKTFT
jgi:hypothetical protein